MFRNLRDSHSNQSVSSLEELYYKFFNGRPPKPAVENIFRESLRHGIVKLHDFERVFRSLALSQSLPDVLTIGFAKHFTMWLEIVNHGYFTPIITEPGRLRTLVKLLTSLPRVSACPPMRHIADIGTGHPPFTTIDLAAQFNDAEIHGFDLYHSRYLLSRQDGAFAVFDTEVNLRAVHARTPECLHRLILDWPSTVTDFYKHLNRLIYLDTHNSSNIVSDGGWNLESWPTQKLLYEAGNPNITFHQAPPGDFQLLPLQSATLDLVWSFNCLLHYPPEFRMSSLALLGSRCRPGGFIFEGYTSPSGVHAVFQLWQKQGDFLQPLQFGWTANNLRYPLWPLHADDPQVDMLAQTLCWIKGDAILGPRIKADISSYNAPSLRTVTAIAKRFSDIGIPTLQIEENFLIHDTENLEEIWGVKCIPIISLDT